MAAVIDPDELLATQPDCVIHTPQALDPDAIRGELEFLLRNGVNVVTTAASGAMHPRSSTPWCGRASSRRAPTGTRRCALSGLSLGFANELVAIVMSGICSEITHVHVGEYANLAHYESTITSDLLGWGKEPGYALPTDS